MDFFVKHISYHTCELRSGCNRIFFNSRMITFSSLLLSQFFWNLIELCLQVFHHSLTLLWYSVSWTYFCSQFRQSRYMICRSHVIGILFLFHTFVSDFLVFILNTIAYTFTLLLLKRYPNIKWTYQYFHLAMMFTFGAKGDEKLSIVLQSSNTFVRQLSWIFLINVSWFLSILLNRFQILLT